MLKPYLQKVINRQNLTATEAQEAMMIIMTGNATQAQIGAYLAALRMKGETVDEITGSARAMRAQANRASCTVNGESLFDTAGTGGDGAFTYNISTGAAFVIAGAGRKVAKHGNRAASSKCGSADVLTALGVNIQLKPEEVAECIQKIGVGFLFAPNFHPAMKFAAGPRKEIGQRTIFNLLGPLTNPAGATHQVVGVFDVNLTHTLAEVLGELGARAALVVHGHGGLDEMTTIGENRISFYHDGYVEDFVLNAADLGLRPASVEDLKGGEPQENAHILRGLLNGEDDSPRRDVLLLNSAAALVTENSDFPAALQIAEKSLASGAALERLEALVKFSQQVVS